MGADGYYYASTTDEGASKNRIIVYMWQPGTSSEFAEKSHTCSFETVDTTPYRLCIIPYKQIRDKFKLREIPFEFKDGGMWVSYRKPC